MSKELSYGHGKNKVYPIEKKIKEGYKIKWISPYGCEINMASTMSPLFNLFALTYRDRYRADYFRHLTCEHGFYFKVETKAINPLERVFRDISRRIRGETMSHDTYDVSKSNYSYVGFHNRFVQAMFDTGSKNPSHDSVSALQNYYARLKVNSSSELRLIVDSLSEFSKNILGDKEYDEIFG